MHSKHVDPTWTPLIGSLRLSCCPIVFVISEATTAIWKYLDSCWQRTKNCLKKITELKRWIVTEILWKRNRTSLSSPEIWEILRPRCLRKSNVEELNGNANDYSGAVTENVEGALQNVNKYATDALISARNDKRLAEGKSLKTLLAEKGLQFNHIVPRCLYTLHHSPDRILSLWWLCNDVYPFISFPPNICQL